MGTTGPLRQQRSAWITINRRLYWLAALAFCVATWVALVVLLLRVVP